MVNQRASRDRGWTTGAAACAAAVLWIHGSVVWAAEQKGVKADQAGTVQPAMPKLLVGDAAPPLSIERWVKGEKVAAFEPGRIYVVEFWATWCAPCVDSIPHLSDLQKKHQEAGVRVIGVASQEMSPDAVDRFLNRRGVVMEYAVAIDAGGASNRAWMEAAAQPGIPTAFVVNQKGRIAWMGHPMDGLDEVVERVLSEKYDLDAAAAAHRRKMDLAARAAPIVARFREHADAGEHAEAIAAAEELLALDAREFGRYAIIRYQIESLGLKDGDRAAREGAAAVAGVLKDQPRLLVSLALVIMDDARLDKRDFGLAASAAARADELWERKRSDVAALRARIAAAQQQWGEAAELMDRAANQSEDATERDRLRQTADEYRSKAEK